MLRVEGIERTVGEFRLSVHDWFVERGQYVVMVGPSGAGKTMLLETLAGLNHLAAGRVWIDDHEVTGWAPEKRGIGLVYQDCWLFPHLTVRSNIDFGRRYHKALTGEPSLQTDALAKMLRISYILDRLPRTLSGGERQRVALARALAIRPRLLFLDEPLGNLDPANREHVASELLACHRQLEMTTIHVTHDHMEARMMGDAAAVILDGRMEQSGPTDEVFGRPRTAALARFLGCENIHAGRAENTSSAGQVAVDLGGQSLKAESELTGNVVVCVPPEQVFLSAEESGPPGGLRGRIRQVSKRGALARLIVDVHGRDWISTLGVSELRRDGLGQGQEVTIHIPANACHLISAENDI